MAPLSDDVSRRSRWLPLLCAVALGLGCLLATPAAHAREVVHVVQKGQWLEVIAKRYHTTSDAILKRNNMKSNDLKPGMKLIIVETAEHRKWRQHVEKSTGKRVPERVHRKKEAPAPQKPAPKKVTPKKAAPQKTASEPKPVAPPPPAAPREIKSAKQRVAPRAVATPAPEPPAKSAGPKGAPAAPRDPGPSASDGGEASATAAAAPKATAKSYAKKPKRPGYVTLIRYGEKFQGQLVASNGKVIAKSSERVDRLLRSLRTGKQAKINRRLLGLLTQVSDHFGGRTIVVVSGFRPYSAKQYTRNSRHNHGEAVDFKVTGVPTDAVFELCRQFDDVGCGYYPNSGFVHMDVRGRKTQWTDYSRPGQAPKYAKRGKRASSRNGTRAPASGKAAPTEPKAAADGRGAKRDPAAKD